MNQRLIGFALVAISVVGTIFAFGSLDTTSSGYLARQGLGYAMSLGVTFGGLPFGIALAGFSAVALVGVGFLLFGKKE